MITKLFCLSLVIGMASSAAWRAKIPSTPKELAHKRGCFIKEINDVIEYNGSVSLVGICEARHCHEDWIEIYTCGAVKASRPECFLTHKDYSRVYPQCCQKEICDIGENLLAE